MGDGRYKPNAADVDAIRTSLSARSSAISTASGHAGRQHPVLEASAVAEGAGLRASIRIMRGVVAGGALSQTSAVSIPKVADESDEAFEAAFRASFRITAP